jgi:dihydrofolate reductase
LIISLIVAMDKAGGIGKNGRLPWHLRTDMLRFKQLTMGHHLIMGRKTFESIGKQLPGRRSIVITRSSGAKLPRSLSTVGETASFDVVHSLKEAIALAERRLETEVFVIGGAKIFALALPLADRLYLTRVLITVDCDVFFPALDMAGWQVVEETYVPADEYNQYPTTYQRLVRLSPE